MAIRTREGKRVWIVSDFLPDGEGLLEVADTELSGPVHVCHIMELEADGGRAEIQEAIRAIGNYFPERGDP